MESYPVYPLRIIKEVRDDGIPFFFLKTGQLIFDAALTTHFALLEKESDAELDRVGEEKSIALIKDWFSRKKPYAGRVYLKRSPFGIESFSFYLVLDQAALPAGTEEQDALNDSPVIKRCAAKLKELLLSEGFLGD